MKKEPDALIIEEKPKMSNAKLKKARRAAAAKEGKNREEPSKEDENAEADRRCAVCKAEFSSKNKLFTHLKNTGHSIYLGQGSKKKTKR